MASVLEINPLSDSRWETFVHSHPRSSVFHSTNWLRALQMAYGYNPVVVTTSAPEAALTNGLVFCRVNSWLTGRRLVSLPFSDHCEPLVRNSNELDDLLVHMRRDVEKGSFKYIEIRPTSSEPGSQTGLTQSDTYSFHRLDLRKNEQDLFRSFHKDCVQRKIRRAEREKLHYEEGTSEILLQQFYNLLVVTRRRQYLPPQPLSWFRGLLATFGTDLKIRVATKDGLPIASILTLNHKKTMVYKYAGSNAEFHNLGGMAFLFWKAIQEAQYKGLEQFEMGRSDSDNLGLIAFKEHWGAAGTELHYWKYTRSPGKDADSLEKSVLRRLVPITPDSVLRIMGGLLYRHVG
ncbi:MAG TPA: GNAT family N-acetyltransferase [Terriglobales bacterium]|nr:GNAT family N-acetyltransferase [Terriglobales bacterium]